MLREVGPVLSKRSSKLLAIAGLLLVLAGCAQAQPALAPATYATDLTREEVPERFGPPWAPERYSGRAFLVGRWELTFDETDKVVWTKDGLQSSRGEYSVISNMLEFGFDSLCNLEDIQSGSYEWSIDGDVVTFVRIEDDCEGRAIVLTLKPWLKQ